MTGIDKAPVGKYGKAYVETFVFEWQAPEFKAN